MRVLLSRPYSSLFIHRKILTFSLRKILFSYTIMSIITVHYFQLISRFTTINHDKTQYRISHRLVFRYINMKKEDFHHNIKNSFTSSSYAHQASILT